MRRGEDGFRYLAAVDVERALPGVAGRLALARRAMTALVADAELPPKIGVHPRAGESFAHAMPAFVRGSAGDGSDDLLGIKWVTGFSANRAAGLPQIHASVLLSDPLTGQPRAVLDGGPITAHRTAAVSGVAIERWRSVLPAGPLRIALVGAGVQAGSHLPVIGHLLPGSTLVVSDLHAGRAEALAAEAIRSGDFADAEVAGSANEAVTGAQLVITVVSFGPDRQAIPAETFGDARLIVAVDYDMCVPASVAVAARPFAVDERGQFLANRATGIFAGYPDPATTIGEALLRDGGDGGDGGEGGDTSGPAGTDAASGQIVLVTHLGVGVADLVFADAILREAQRLGLGTALPR